MDPVKCEHSENDDVNPELTSNKSLSVNNDRVTPTAANSCSEISNPITKLAISNMSAQQSFAKKQSTATAL